MSAVRPALTERDRPGWPVLLAFLVAGSALGVLGSSTRIPGTELAAAWPSAGVAVLWLLVRRAAAVSIDTALMFGTMLGFGLLVSENPPWLVLALSSIHILQTVLVVGLLRRFLPDLWGCGGNRSIDSPRVLATYLGCVGAGVLVSAVAVSLVWLVMGDADARYDVLLWLGRNSCGILLVTTPGLLLFQYLAQPPPRPPLRKGGWLEFLAACLSAVATYVVVFVADEGLLLFLLLGVVVWCGLRFATLVNSLHILVLGYLAVWATIGGSGPFAHDKPLINALVVQLFVVATASTGLALSTALEERSQLNNTLRQTSDEMTYQAQLLHAVVNSMAEGLAVVDDSGRWLLRNPAATRVGGFAGDLRVLLANAAGEHDPITLALAGETVHDQEIQLPDAAGGGRILAVSAAPLPRDSVTGRARALMIFRDATVEHARRIDLTAFAQVVAHDLRNPLAAVESWTQMMAGELEAGEVEPGLIGRYIDRVGSGTHRMKGLIEDLLDRATHDSALQLRRVDVGALADEVARDHGSNGHVTIGPIPDVLADPALVRQVLDNLVANSLKFVPPGTEPKVRVSGRRTGSGTVAIAVTDEGIGLPAGSHDLVFQERLRMHPEYDGRGLGLAICRRIVERHGGSISARDNTTGRGTVVEFTLPSPD